MNFILTIKVDGDKANYSTNGIQVPTQLALEVLQSVSKQIVNDLISKSTVGTPPVSDPPPLDQEV